MGPWESVAPERGDEVGAKRRQRPRSTRTSPTGPEPVGCRASAGALFAELHRVSAGARAAAKMPRGAASGGDLDGQCLEAGGPGSVLSCQRHVERAHTESQVHDAERERVIALLRAHAADIKSRGVTRLALFGSIARGDAGPSSDVDLLIEVDPHACFTLVDLVGLERFLTDLLLRPVEFAFPGRLRERPPIWRRVQADALDVL
jgi:predicted nucleotidyltransferase